MASFCGVGCLLGRVWQGKVWQAWQVAVRLDRVGVGEVMWGMAGKVRHVMDGCVRLCAARPGKVRYGSQG